MWAVINAGLMVLCIDLDETAKYRLSTRPSPALLFIFWALIPDFFPNVPTYQNFLTIQAFNICVSFVFVFCRTSYAVLKYLKMMMLTARFRFRCGIRAQCEYYS